MAFWSKCQYTLHYMRRPFSLRLNINMKRGNALQFYQALHLRMPEVFISISNPHRAWEAFRVWFRTEKEVHIIWYLDSSLAIFKYLGTISKCLAGAVLQWENNLELGLLSSSEKSGLEYLSWTRRHEASKLKVSCDSAPASDSVELWALQLRFLGKTLYPRRMLPLSHSSLLYSSTEKFISFRIFPDSGLWVGLFAFPVPLLPVQSRPH